MVVSGRPPHLFVLVLVVLHGGQVREVALQGLDALLLLPILLCLLLALLLQVVDVLISTANLHRYTHTHARTKWAMMKM